MPKPYRLLAFAMLLAFGGMLGSYAWTSGTPLLTTRDSRPELLPAAIAAPVDVVVEDTLRSGETLSELLERAQLAELEASALLQAMQEHQDPRRMKPGSVVAFRKAIDDGEIRKMELRLDPDRTLALARNGAGWEAQIEEVPVHAETVVLTGTVESSLYNALLIGEGGSTIPADEREKVVDLLADKIFAWEVDFSRDLRTGDRFRILYERLTRPDGTARSGRVLSVQFNINNQDYEAYAFTAADGSEDYYDGEGDSLRRAFLRAPLEYRRISSAFSRSRFHPVLKVSRAHNGIDYAASAGTPVRAVGDGTVRRASSGGDFGNLVEIAHARGYASRYAHLRGFASGIRPGVRVKQGDIIGYVGSTGLATGPHLHFEFHQNGRAIDPNAVREITGEPVPGSYRSQFLEVVRTYIASLDVTSPRVLAKNNGASQPATGD